ITSPAILLYVAAGMIFFVFRSVFCLYGRPSMIFWEYASPMPGNVSSCSLVAEFRSIKSAAAFFSDGAEAFFSAAGSAFVSGFLAGAGAFANPNVAKSNVVRTATISLDRCDFVDIPPSKFNSYSLHTSRIYQNHFTFQDERLSTGIEVHTILDPVA